jgi:oxygen-independent coproporphyrinogen-3 oxidase
LEGEALHEEIISVYIHGRIGSFQDAVCKRS